MSESLLPDFDPLIDECRRELTEFELGDYIITPEMKSAYLAFNKRYSRFKKLELYNYSLMIARTEDGECWVPASTLKQCAIVVPFYQAMLRYRHVLTQLVDQFAIGYTKKDVWCSEMRDHKASQEVVDRVEQITLEYFTNTYPNTPEEQVKDAVMKFMRFLTDYPWWLGSKQATRNNDWYNSPLNGILSRAAASNEITTIIIDNLANDSALRIAAENLPHVVETKDETELTEETERRQTGNNIIIYGAPGVGKSFAIEHDMYPQAKRVRVMFHPEYSYFDFVGTFRPTPVYHKDGQALVGEDGIASNAPGIPYIDYSYHAGPFTKMVVDAINDPTHDYCLIIEEINRANAASVFGDMFQLLDRGADRSSDYAIQPQMELASWLRANKQEGLAKAFRIPSNMSIVATMNSADLGVTFLDAAFKRRWNYRYIPIDLSTNSSLDAVLMYNNAECTLSEVIGAINERMAGIGINEDRRVGPFFVSPLEMRALGTDAALQKVIMYLWDDVFRDRRAEFFDESLSTLGEVQDAVAVADPFEVWAYIADARARATENEADIVVSEDIEEE